VALPVSVPNGGGLNRGRLSSPVSVQNGGGLNGGRLSVPVSVPNGGGLNGGRPAVISPVMLQIQLLFVGVLFYSEQQRYFGRITTLFRPLLSYKKLFFKLWTTLQSIYSFTVTIILKLKSLQHLSKAHLQILIIRLRSRIRKAANYFS
jgi:hypothetical protein